MLRVAAILLRVGALIYLTILLLPTVTLAIGEQWLLFMVLVIPGLAFASLLLWLSHVVARRRYLWFAGVLLGFLGFCSALAMIMMCVYAFPKVAIIGSGVWTSFLLATSGLIMFSRKETARLAIQTGVRPGAHQPPMTEDTIVRVKIISSDRTPEMITDALGVPCDDCWHSGEVRTHTIITEKDNGWLLHSGLPKSASLEEHIAALLNILAPYREKIRSLSCKDTVELSCVIYAARPPALNFASSIINQLGELGASLDIDLYLTE
jgi:hypothetical protein